MARPRKIAITLGSIEECSRSMSELLKAQLELEILTAERDHDIAVVSSSYEKRIDTWKQIAYEQEEALRHYYMTHSELLEQDGSRSCKLANGVIGRRLSPPKLAPLNRAWTWNAIIVKLQSLFPGKYLRTKAPEVDKDLIKAELTPDQLATVGLKLDQDEVFYAEPTRLPAPAEVQEKRMAALDGVAVLVFALGMFYLAVKL